MRYSGRHVSLPHFTIACFVFLIIVTAEKAASIRFADRISESVTASSNQPLKTAVFALGSFWRSEAAFGCLDGVVRTTAGYAGGSKVNPEFRSWGDHAESVQFLPKPRGLGLMKTHSHVLKKSSDGGYFVGVWVRGRCSERIEYNPRLINYRQLLEVFWSSHDSRQVFGQGPDVGNQYRSIIFTNGTEELRLAAVSKEREQTTSKGSIVTTQIQQLGKFYQAEPEHQKFELKRKPFLLQLMGNLPEEELEKSTLAAKLNSFAAEFCSPKIQKQIDARIDEIIRKGWPVLRDV